MDYLNDLVRQQVIAFHQTKLNSPIHSMFCTFARAGRWDAYIKAGKQYHNKEAMAPEIKKLYEGLLKEAIQKMVKDTFDIVDNFQAHAEECSWIFKDNDNQEYKVILKRGAISSGLYDVIAGTYNAAFVSMDLITPIYNEFMKLGE